MAQATEQEHSHVRFHMDSHLEASPSNDDVGVEMSEVSVHPSATPSLEQQLTSGGQTNGNDNNNAQPRLSRQPSFLTEHESEVRSTLVWRDLTVTVMQRGQKVAKTLLREVSGCMSGGLWAVMGPSGCGKSTLLNTLACRLDVNTTVSGEMRLNGRPYRHAELKKMSGYVMQDDLLNPNLTVRETLYYTAALRLPKNMSAEDRDVRVDEVIREMGLLHCQNVIVGDPSKKGISGGERRRVCIGMELLTRPSLLFLDEPTSGLDSVTSLSLGRLLRRLTRKRQCSIICSVHQPQARLFALFDRLLLLKSGRILYQGSIPGVLQLFEDCGFPVPHYSNPADHMLDVITPPLDGRFAPGGQQKEKQLQEAARVVEHEKRLGLKGQDSLILEVETADQARTVGHGLIVNTDLIDDHLTEATPLGRALTQRRKKTMDYADRIEAEQGLQTNRSRRPSTTEEGRPDLANEEMLVRKFRQPSVDLNYGSEKPVFVEEGAKVSWFRQLRILAERNLKENLRQRDRLITALLQQIIIAVLIGTVFLFIGKSQTSTTRRQPVLQFVCINQGAFAAMSVVSSFPEERSLMLRERAAGTYHASAYFLAKTSIDSILALPQILVFSLITYYLIGFQDVASKFVIYLLFMILCNYSATSLALMVSALCKTTDVSTVVLSLVLEICRLFGGFFLAPINLPKYFSWLDALSYIKYTYVGISLNELHGLELHCNPGEFAKDGSCPQTTGQQTITKLGLDFISMNGCAGVLVGYIIFTRFVAYMGIRFLKSSR